MAVGKLDAYGLGEQGVELVESPIHLAEGALLQAQNAALDRVESEGGLTKRLGISAFTGAPAAASILAIVNVAWTDPSP